jgi:hypothetical protein
MQVADRKAPHILACMQVNHGKPHYTSWHGKIGLAASISTCAVLLGGAISFRKLGFLQYFPDSKQFFVKKAHRLAAPLIFSVALLNVFIGLGHPAAGERVWLHMLQRTGIVMLTIGELYVLWGHTLLGRLGWCSADKAV